MMSSPARMIASNDDFAGAPLLRGAFRLSDAHGPVVSARLRLSALGVVEAWVGGRPASDEVLTPGWSSYEWRVRYSELDVREHVLGVGPEVVVGLALGNGWYRGRLAWRGGSHYYGTELAGFAQILVGYADGHEQTFGTDASWTAGPSATTANDLYDGQSIDARLRDRSWLAPGFASAAWVGVHEVAFDADALEPFIGPPVRRQETRDPVRVWTAPSGRVLADFGQNIVGWVRAELTGPRDTVITIRHAEVLEHGELGVRPLRSAAATDRFTLSGGDDVFEPTFTFHGFRYVELDGWPGGAEAVSTSGLRAVVVSSELRRIGRFACSNPLLNRFHENAVHGMRGNFLDVPTDCPQRDERLGWTGDIAVFAASAAFLFDVGAFLRDWLRDVALEQKHAGAVPIVVPDVLKLVGLPEGFPPTTSTAVWSDAAVWVPWAIWMAYGDPTVLHEQWPSMTAHGRAVAQLLSANGVWDTGFQFGDWLDPDAPPESPELAKADPGVVATLAAYRTARILTEAAQVLGDDTASVEFEGMASRLRTAFTSVYLERGRISSDCATVYALAIAFDILAPSDRAAAGDRLAQLVTEGGYRISTGFAGTPFVTEALSATGHPDAAYRLLLQTECPSWLYPVTMGATTVWERWDSMLPDGRINPGEMTSFNHYALGAVIDWVHRTVGGLTPLEPGYRRILIAPRPGGDLSWAETTLETPHGVASVRWSLDGDRFEATVEVPPGTSATLSLPGATEELVAAGIHRRSVRLPTTGVMTS